MLRRRRVLTQALAYMVIGPALCTTVRAAQEQNSPNSEPHPVRFVDPRWMKKKWRRQIVRSPYNEPVGTIIVDARSRFLYLIQDNGTALRYGVAVGREGIGWAGMANIARKAKWPSWTSTARMDTETPGYSFQIDGGPGNPLGARALYLYANGKDTLYRLHGGGTRQTIGNAVSAGCIRLLDQDIIDLYGRVQMGAKVIVIDPRA